jgi:hypothetical protein
MTSSSWDSKIVDKVCQEKIVKNVSELDTTYIFLFFILINISHLPVCYIFLHLLCFCKSDIGWDLVFFSFSSLVGSNEICLLNV